MIAPPPENESAVQQSLNRHLTIAWHFVGHGRLDGISDFDGIPFFSSPNALVLIDDKSCYVDVNSAALRMLGYTREQLVGMHTSDLVLGLEPGEAESINSRFRRAGEDAGLFRLRGAGGELRVLIHSRANVAPGLHLGEIRVQDVRQ